MAKFDHLFKELGVEPEPPAIGSSSSSAHSSGAIAIHAVQTPIQQPPFITTRVLIFMLVCFLVFVTLAFDDYSVC
jgi:hypothetical protein